MKQEPILIDNIHKKSRCIRSNLLKENDLVEVRKINTHNREKKLDDIVYDDFISTLRQIKEGNHQLREEFISEYKPFILKVTSNATGKYIDTRNSDEFSIALSAFNEAIDKFDIEKGYNFFLFSEQVIRRRLIDYSRSNKDDKEYPFSFFDDEYFYNNEKLLSKSYIGLKILRQGKILKN